MRSFVFMKRRLAHRKRGERTYVSNWFRMRTFGRFSVLPVHMSRDSAGFVRFVEVQNYGIGRNFEKWTAVSHLNSVIE